MQKKNYKCPFKLVYKSKQQFPLQEFILYKKSNNMKAVHQKRQKFKQNTSKIQYQNQKMEDQNDQQQQLQKIKQKDCRIRINLKTNQQIPNTTYQLQKFNNKHIHQCQPYSYLHQLKFNKLLKDNVPVKIKQLQQQRNKIKSKLQQDRTSQDIMKLQNLKKQIKKFKYRTSKIQQKEKFNKYVPGIIQLAQFFQENNIDYKTQPFLQHNDWQEIRLNNRCYIPDVITFVNSLMIQNYKIFGQIIKFHQIQNFYQLSKASKRKNNNEQEENQDRKNNIVGLILGTDSSSKLIGFGIAIYLQKSSHTYYNIFKQFLSLVKPHENPQTIATGSSDKIKQGIQRLNLQFKDKITHIYDPQQIIEELPAFGSLVHILPLFKRMITSKYEFQCDKLVNLLIYGSSQDILDSSMQKGRNSLIQLGKLDDLTKFIQKIGPKCFFSKISPCFAGLYRNSTYYTSYVQIQLKFHTKKYTSFKQNLEAIISKLEWKQNNSEYLFQFPRKKYPNFFQIPVLRDIQKRVSFQIYQYILQNYFIGLQLNYVEGQPNKRQSQQRKVIMNFEDFICQNLQDKYPKDISVSLTYGRWACSCVQSFKTGIPCAHQIKIILASGHKILDYIHPRWIRDIQRYNQAKLKLMPWKSEEKKKAKGDMRNL